MTIEALLVKTYGKYPQRNCVGVDPKRLDLVCAVLERYCNAKLGTYDIYINVPCEFKLYDSGLDLAIAVAILSQYKNKPVPPTSIFIGEIGLTGSILKTRLHDKRKKELPDGYHVVDYEVRRTVSRIDV